MGGKAARKWDTGWAKCTWAPADGIREELHGTNRVMLKKVEPLNIPQFLLYGKSIGVVEFPHWEEPLEAELLANAMAGGEMEAALTIFPPQQVGRPPEAEVKLPDIVPELNKNEEVKTGIPKECKRLAEVDFPIAVVSKHSAREKSIRHGHPSTLHLWWARRPLAACRSMLLALLLPDPCDPHCPEDFKSKAREILPKVQGAVGPKDENLRQSLLRFIGDFSNWDLSANPAYLEVSRGLVKAAHPEETPLVVDPFAGGGSIPLEALRLGCEAFASDLNPVACLILKVMLEDIPRHGPTLADELRQVGKEIKEAVEKELAEFYPTDPDGAKPIAYLWARTVRCESPNCGAEIPLMRSFWLCKKAKRKRALKYKVIPPSSSPSPARGEGRIIEPRVEFEIFEPKNDKDVPPGTVNRAKAKCLCCEPGVLSPDRVKAQLRQQCGGGDVIFDANGNRIGGARLLAVVTLNEHVQGRNYRIPMISDYKSVWKARNKYIEIRKDKLPNGLEIVPNELLPPTSTGFLAPPIYGMKSWGDLFTDRQKIIMTEFTKIISQLTTFREVFALALTKLSSGYSSLSVWRPPTQDIGNIFERMGLGMCWDFAEANPFAGATRSWDSVLNDAVNVVAYVGAMLSGATELADACSHPLPDETNQVWFTDPPYYFAVPYADLSDFYFVWLKRALPEHPLVRDPFDSNNPLTPKERELCEMAHWDSCRYGYKDKSFFENGMKKAFFEGCRILKHDGIGCVVFAHKTTEGWEALLSGMIQGGWTITGSWPIATEMGSRLRARDSAALATSVHLVCRPRPQNRPIGDWGMCSVNFQKEWAIGWSGLSLKESGVPILYLPA